MVLSAGVDGCIKTWAIHAHSRTAHMHGHEHGQRPMLSFGVRDGTVLGVWFRSPSAPCPIASLFARSQAWARALARAHTRTGTHTRTQRRARTHTHDAHRSTHPHTGHTRTRPSTPRHTHAPKQARTHGRHTRAVNSPVGSHSHSRVQAASAPPPFPSPCRCLSFPFLSFPFHSGSFFRAQHYRQDDRRRVSGRNCVLRHVCLLRPHLHRDWTQPCHICIGTGLAPPASTLWDWARPRHICAGTALTLARCAPFGLAPEGVARK